MKSRRNTLFILLGLFLLSRILTLAAFPIFNDEAIYLQYAQRIHDDWEKNKFISMHGEFTDWKPPLIYWIAAPFIEWGNDPLLAGRAVAFLASIAGFFGFYLFAKELFGEREGVITALLYVLCPPVLFHNIQFTAETFLISTAALFYWALLKAMQRDKTRWWIWALVAMLLGAALLLFKQSGFLLLAVSVLLPLASLRTGEEDNRDRRYNWKVIGLSVSLVVAVIICSSIAADALLPSAFNSTRDHFNSRWVLSIAEVFRFPMDIWRTNLGVVADYVTSYYTWAVPLFFGAFIGIAIWRKNFSELALAAMGLAGFIAVTFLLRGFNEYMLNTAVIVVLLPSLGRMVIFLYTPAGSRRVGLLRWAAVFVGVIGLAHWAGQDILMGTSSGRYLERSTPWAISNYLTRWSTGFGVKETMAILEQEKRPGILFIDAQWGNPGTALEVYGKERFPHLRIVPVSREFLDQAETRKLKEAALKVAPAHFAVYSADTDEARSPWQTNLQAHMCESRREIKAYPAQAPIVVCSF
jgi:4-amino-4-deoxy-L-arabinose transferase-like glycosyltransferase